MKGFITMGRSVGVKLQANHGTLFLRSLRKKDLQGVLEIETHSTDKFWGGKHFIRAMQQPGHFSFVATEIDKIVGFIVGRIRRGKVEIQNLGVHPDYLRRGIGTTLLSTAIDVSQTEAGEPTTSTCMCGNETRK
jgi:ribosomal protein S18 acetylase RimI-like enzyme